MPNLSINLLYDSYENPEAAAHSVYPFLDRAPFDALQVTTGARREQGRTFALQLKQRYPSLDAILRLMPDENPALYQRYPNPADYVASVAPWASGGLILGIGNEAGVSDLAAQDAWYAPVVEGLGKLGIRSVTPSVQTHNRFAAAAFDATYRMLAKYGGMFSLHYYGDPVNGLPIDPIHETVETYCAAQGIRIQFAITELGYAKWLGSFAGYNGRIASADYAAQLVTAARRWPRVRFFVYGWGKQDPWGDFDISGDKLVQDAIVAHNLEVTQPAVPNRETLGDPIVATVISTAANVVNDRADTSTSAAIVGTFKTGDTITLRPTPTGTINGYQWYGVEAPVLGWSAAVFKWQAGQADTPVVKLAIPFVSQSGINANKTNEDCGAACAISKARYRYQRAGFADPVNFTVDDFAMKTRLVTADNGLTPPEVATLLTGYGVRAVARRPLLLSDLAAALDADDPPIILVNYKWLNPNHPADLGHFVIVYAYGENGFWYNDPFLLGAGQYVSNETLTKAMSDVSTFATFPNQGVTLAA